MPDRQAQIEQAFLAAAACPGQPERERLIAARCNGDAELIAEVRSLLGGHEAAGGVLDRRNAALPPSLAWSGLPSQGGGAGNAGLPPGTRIGGYRLVRVIGAGGMGVVYVAEQERPRRTVAIKLIRSSIFGLGGSGDLLRRFEVEADILGRLRHPGIAQIYEAGAALVEPPAGQEGTTAPAALAVRQPFLAMELIDGPTITEFAQRGELSTRHRVELLAHVCDAVEHAHQRGVIHRDLKPCNILVDPGGDTPQIKVLDFGVARVTGADLRVTTLQTSVGQLIGTLPYMSPEQVAGDPGAIDTRSDVYALGVVLYQLLTGRLPHDLSSRSIPEAARIIRDELPLPPSRHGGNSRLTSALRGDIDTIVAKAIEKEKSRRYQSARDLGEDLRRHLAGEPIAAKRDSVGYILQKKLRRYRALVTLGAAALLAVSGLGVYAAFSAVKSRRLARDLSAQLSDSKIERARLLSRTEQPGMAESLIWEELFKRPGSRLARWALWDVYMRSPCLASLPDFKQSSFDCAFSPDGSVCGVANRIGGKVELWDSDLKTLLHTLDVCDERAFTLAFLPGGSAVATGGSDGRLKLWDVKTGSCTLDQHAHANWIQSVATAPDGRWLATADRDGLIKLWSGPDWTTSRSLEGHTAAVHEVAFSADSSMLVSGSQDRTARVWDVQSGQCLVVLDAARGGHSFDVSTAAFHPDGKTLVTGSFDKTVKLWDIPSFTCRATLESVPGYPAKIVFSPDGSRVYISGDGVQTHDARDGKLINTLIYPEGTRRSIAVHPSGRRLLVTASRGRVSLWETDPGLARTDLASGGWPCQLAFSPDGRALATNGRRGVTRVYTVGDWSKPTVELPGSQSFVQSMGFSPDGGRLITGTRDGRLVLWNLGTLEKLADVEGHPQTPIMAAAFSPEGGRVLTLGTDHHLKVWSVPDLIETGNADIRALGQDGRGGSVTTAIWSPDGTRIATGSGMPHFGLWNADGLTPERNVVVGTTQSALAFPPDPSSVVLCLDRTIVWLDLQTGKLGRELVGHSQGIAGLNFSQDGLLVSASRDHSVRLWDWPSGLSLLILPTGAATPAYQALSSDGRYVAVSMSNGAVSVWDLWYYNPHLAGNAEWNVNQLDAATVTPEGRARLLEAVRRAPGATGAGH